MENVMYNRSNFKHDSELYR